MYQTNIPKFIYNFFSQNVLKTPNRILPTHFYNSSINIGSISFFSPSDMHQSHHLLGCHATGINSLLNSFFKFLAFSKFNMLDKKPALTREKIKTICLTKQLFFNSY